MSKRSALGPSPRNRTARWARLVVGPLAALLFLGGGAGCEKVEFEPVPSANVDQAVQSKAEGFATTLLGAWARDEYPPLGEDATEEMRNAHTEEEQKKADKQIEKEIGSFKSLEFNELQRTKPPQFDVYRFKATFDKSQDPVEVRVVYDTAGKVTGFWVKPWKDKMN